MYAHPDPADVSDLSDVPCRAVGLDLQIRPVESKVMQSAKAMNRTGMAPEAIKH